MKCEFNNIDPELKKEMIARLIQIITLILMSTSCYSFGGELYLQDGGAGIGERSSACLAKVVMSIWDIIWSTIQKYAGLNVNLFFRYIDDIRLYLQPINVGWMWDGRKWHFDQTHQN